MQDNDTSISYKADHIKNKQVNYTIIKELWKLRAPKSTMREFYETIDIGRERYRRILNGDTYSIPRLATTSDNLNRDTGVDVNIFTGHTMLCVNGISRDDWEEYFGNIGLLREGLLSDKDKRSITNDIMRFYDMLRSKLNDVPMTDNVDFELYKLYTYFVRDYKFEGEKTDAILIRVIRTMEQLNINRLEKISEKTLAKYLELLETQYKMVSVLNAYREYKK